MSSYCSKVRGRFGERESLMKSHRIIELVASLSVPLLGRGRVTCGRKLRFRVSWLAAACVVVSLSLSAVSVRACDTPVFRYALYRWTPTPYILCRIHDGPEQDATVAEVRQLVEQAAEDAARPANVVWVDVDASIESQLENIPAFVRQRWENRDAGTKAAYFLVAPHGVIIDNHEWTPGEVDALLDSSVRTKIGEELEAAKAGVVVLLDHPGKKQAGDEAAKTIEQALAKIRTGKLELATAPSVKNPEVAFVRLSKDDLKEAWLVRQLLEVESDLSSVDEPIVFVLFGRGRALFSCLGKGITEENLARDIEFVSGACSCTVKEQNPGVDLLMRYDWENAATVVAEKYGGETGTDALLDGDQLFPELALPPSEKPSEQKAAPEGSAQADASSPPSDDVSTETQLVASTADESEQDSGDESSSGSSNEAAAEKPVAADDQGSPPLASRTVVGDESEASSASATSRIGLWRVAVGLGAALIGMFAVTWLVLRPRSG